MAKIVKKKPAAKPAAKSAKKAPAKAAPKTAVKKAAPKAVVKKKAEKAPAKAPAKVVKKAEVKKKVVATPAKSAKVAAKAPAKPVAKAAAKPVKPSKPEVAPKKAEKPEKVVKAKDEKLEKKVSTPVEEVTEKASIKKDAKSTAAKKGKVKKEKTEEAIEDDFISDDDMGGEDIGEYEEELKAVEELDEEVEVDEVWVEEDKAASDDEIFLTDAEGRRYCRARDCDQIAIVDAYCRFHYLMFWKKIQVRKKILQDGKLERYVEELTSRYPDKFLEMIRRDLRTEKDFLAAIQELEIDESAGENEFEEDNSAFIEEVRGMGEGASSGVDDDDY